MSQNSYSPFSGWQGGAQNGGALGSKLKPIDWSKTALVPGQWVVPAGGGHPVSPPPAGASNGAHPSAADDKAELKKALEKSKTSNLSEEDTAKWRAEHQITIFGENCPAPILRFEDAPLLPSVMESFKRQGFNAPTPIQSQAWPILFQNRDMVGIAKTGSGKTIAFMGPALVHLAQQAPLNRGDGPIVLVLAPTRELAQQIEVETRKILPPTNRITCVYGGAPKHSQAQELSYGVHILVATPGRLIDFLEIRRTNLLRVTYLVLDEADRMLDMGFEPQIRTICSQVRTDRQTQMFSATWPKEIRNMAASFQRDFIRIHVGSIELLANPDIKQHMIFTSDHEKMSELRQVLMKVGQQRVLVFTKTKRTADNLFRMLRGCGNLMVIHGDKDQHQRNFTLDKFRRERNAILIATDVAARGLDVKELDVVVNYDFPRNIEDFVHRIGRTGRAGKKGDAYSFVTEEEKNIAKELIDILTKAKQEVPQQLVELAMRHRSRGPRAVGPGGFRRPPPLMQHSNRPMNGPSFNTNGSTNGNPHQGNPNQQFFGVPPGNNRGGYNGGAPYSNPPPPTQAYRGAPRYDDPTAAKRTVFRDDDEPAKRVRTEF